MEECLKKIKKAQITARVFRVLCLAAAFDGAALLCFGKMPAGLVCLGAALLAYIFLYRRQLSSFHRETSSALILQGLCRPLEDAAYTGKEGITLPELAERSLLPIAGDTSLLLRQGFRGRKKKDLYRGWETTFSLAIEGKKRDAGDYHSGTLLTCDYASPGEGDLLAVKEGVFPEAVWKPLKEKGYTLEKKQNWVLLSKGGPLPEEASKQLDALLGKAQDLSLLRAAGSQSLAFLQGRFYTYDLKPKDLPAAEQLSKNPLPDRDALWEFFRLWNRRA